MANVGTYPKTERGLTYWNKEPGSTDDYYWRTQVKDWRDLRFVPHVTI